MSDSENESPTDGEPDVQASNDGTAALGEDHTADADDITDGSLPEDADLTADTEK
jgi:hypothetical protein